MNVDDQISGSRSHAVCAAIALAVTVATQTVAQADLPVSGIVHVHP